MKGMVNAARPASAARVHCNFPERRRSRVLMRRVLVFLLLLSASPAAADYVITRDHGGLVEKYKTKYAAIRDKGERVVINGICNSACTLLLGIVPLNRVCVTPKASLGFHQAYYDKAYTFGVKVAAPTGTADLMSYYPPAVKEWIARNGGLTPEMKKVKYGWDQWMMIDPCPEEW
jgi:hypothetical protein